MYAPDKARRAHTSGPAIAKSSMAHTKHQHCRAQRATQFRTLAIHAIAHHSLAIRCTVIEVAHSDCAPVEYSSYAWWASEQAQTPLFMFRCSPPLVFPLISREVSWPSFRLPILYLFIPAVLSQHHFLATCCRKLSPDEAKGGAGDCGGGACVLHTSRGCHPVSYTHLTLPTICSV